MRISSELQFGADQEVLRHVRGREHCRGKSGSALLGGYAPDLANAEGSSMVDEPGQCWTLVREYQGANREVFEGKGNV